MAVCLERPRAWYFLQLSSLVCVALGQPAFFPLMGVLASSIGFALHLRALDLSQSRWEPFFWFFLVQLFQLSWMSSIRYQGTAFLLVYALLAAGMGLQFMFFANKVHETRVLRPFAVFSLAAFGVLLEWSRVFLFCGFTFNFIGEIGRAHV